MKFAASLFKDRKVLTIPISQAQMTADCDYPVVLKAPEGTRLVLDGGGQWRALYVTPRTKLILENVTFRNLRFSNFSGVATGPSELTGLAHMPAENVFFTDVDVKCRVDVKNVKNLVVERSALEIVEKP